MCSTTKAVLAPRTRDAKVEFVEELLAAKAASGKSFDQIAAECGWTNAYAAQLFFNQAQLKEGAAGKLKVAVPQLRFGMEMAAKLQVAVPQLSNEALAVMQRPPVRGFDTELAQDPLIYRLVEAVNHYGESLRALINEQHGDGIMSAIDFFVTADKITGKQGEGRVAITFNGKFLPHIEQLAENNTAATGAKQH
ncbi:cyanate hydratase [Micractinium conductrix]|uniref:Cyanate hydratase n=1 Tax=Micractinium conductrix TaxID=554055 RepID=A0A2P6V3P9_9CHLO|nr:cyanate hydratase [Micractinium conductrix]|eukprot:PSC68704.1 cyanate hydratase [Micractinium conductrix]